MVFVGLVAAAILSAVPHFAERPCAAELATAGARCGTVAVPENRAHPERRSIDLNLIVLPATAERRLPPVFDIEGGPGLADTKNVGFYVTDGSAYREYRDVVLLDQRGTGKSHPLNCPELSNPGYQPLYPAAAVARCRRSLEADADLTQYGTAAAVEDLDAVRAALGYDQLDLYGQSYGTTVILRYLAATADQALRLLSAECAADPACKAAYDPEADLRRALAKFPSIAGAPPPEIFLEKLRSLLYLPMTAYQLPQLIHRAADGDLAPFFALTKGGPSGYFDGAYLSVTCAESFSLFNYAAAAAAARNTRFGDYRVRQQHAACAQWPVAKVSKDYLAPVTANVPVLIVSGGLDPVTPPAWAAEVARQLPNARQVVIPKMGHLFDGLANIECFDAMVLKFLETADPKSVDARCVATMTPPPFKLGG